MNTIPTSTRNDIFDIFRLDNLCYSGKENDIQFLSRLYDLKLLPSLNDDRYKDAERDIWQHTINNDDYELNWVFSDPRFNLLHCKDEKFLDFLVATVNPLVRTDKAEYLVSSFNHILTKYGFKLEEESQIGDYKRYKYNKIDNQTVLIPKDKIPFGTEYINKQIKIMQEAIDNNPYLAIGTAKELVETCLRTIIEEYGEIVDKDTDLLLLTKKALKYLKLVPESIPESAKGETSIKSLLRNLAQITQSMAEIRNLYGSGHGRIANFKGLSARHSRLAVSSATAFVMFIYETYQENKSKGA